jgi:hypothetical protein
MSLTPRIAVVEGDDVSALMPALRDAGTRDMYTERGAAHRGLECERVFRRAADRRRVVGGCRHRHHRPLRRQRRDAGCTDP